MMYKESETIEFKKSTAALKDAVVAIAAMLNKHGQGEVYFGISDDGKVIGQDIGRMTLKEVTQAVVDNIEPNNYIKEHIKWRADMSESRRKEIPEIPVRSFSEAIGNSLCHRDYANPKGNEVAVFKDRVDIYNPGTFPDELDPQDFVEGDGYSILRNPLIAETMYKSEDIEKWASGLKRIYDECTAIGIKVEFKRVKTGFVVSFHRPRWEDGDGLEVSGQKAVDKTTQKTTQKIIEEIKNNSRITRKELSEIIGLTEEGIKYHLGKMQKNGRIRRIGPDKGGHWEVRG